MNKPRNQREYQEIVTLICAVVGSISNVVGILTSVKSWDAAIPFFVISIVLLVSVLAYIFRKYQERCDFIGFIEYLFDNTRHNFNLLPKIFLVLDKTKEVNELHVKNMSVQYTCDMREIKMDELTPNSHIRFPDTVECTLFCDNNGKMPEEFVYYRGNIYAGEPFEISQKHGSKEKYERVPPPRNIDETRSNLAVHRYSWKLMKENITNGAEMPISFKFKYYEKSTASSWSTVVFAPMQYARKVDKVYIKVEVLASKRVVEEVELFKVWKDNDKFKHSPISDVSLEHNKVYATIQPDSTNFEAYYLRIRWQLAPLQTTDVQEISTPFTVGASQKLDLSIDT